MNHRIIFLIMLWIVASHGLLAQSDARYFVAIDIPEDVEAQLFPISELLERRLMGDFEPKEKLHITLYFLGPMPELTLNQTKTLLTQVLAETTSFSIEVRGLGFFPNLQKARVAWIGAHAVEIEQMHRLIQQHIALAPGENLEFHPHITLARLSAVPPKSMLEKYQQQIADMGILAKFDVQEVILMKSAGGKYTPILKIPLRSQKTK